MELKTIIHVPISKSYFLRTCFINFLYCNHYNNGFLETNLQDYCSDIESFQKLIKEYFSNSLSNTKSFNCYESAFIARVLPAFLSVLGFNDFVIVGENSLLKRKIGIDYQFFKQIGWIVEDKENLPISFKNAFLKAGIYVIENPVSSQLISGLIMVLPLLKENSTLIIKNVVSIGYIIMTISMLRKLEIKIEYKIKQYENSSDLEIFIRGNHKKQAYFLSPKIEDNYEGDWSGASTLLVAATITQDTKFVNLNQKSLQPDKIILRLFKDIGIKFACKKDGILVKKSEYYNFEFDATNNPDLVPALVILAAFAKGGVSKIYGTNRLTTKESSRAECLAKELRKLFIFIEIFDNYIEIQPFKEENRAFLKNGIELLSYSDHRIAMAEIVCSYIQNINVNIDNLDCIKKSYPNFLGTVNFLKEN